MGTKSSGRYMRTEAEDPSRNVDRIKFGKMLRAMPKYDKKDVDAVQARFDEFLDMCSDNGMLPTISGLITCLKLRGSDFYNMLKGYQNSAWTPETQALLPEFYEFLEMMYEHALIDCKGNAVPYIFVGKNRFSWRDTRETIQVNVDANKSLPSAEDVAKKYALKVGAVVEDLPPAKEESDGKEG